MRIAVVGTGVAGSYLLNRIPPEHEVEAFEMRREEKWWAVCAWGTSAPFISDLVKLAGLDFDDYILFRGKRMIVDPGDGNTFGIKLNGLVTFDKTRLFGDMKKGKKIHYGAHITDINDLKGFDMVIDATGFHRSLMPKLQHDASIPCFEVEVEGKFPWDDFYIRPYPGLCVQEDTIVLANPGAKTIQNVSVNERVLTRNGYAPVSKTFAREYSGEMVRITPFLCGFPVSLTPDHLVWVLDRKTGNVGWKPAGLVRECHSKSVGDYVGIPIPRPPPVISLKIGDYVEGMVRGGKIFPVGRNQFGKSFAYKTPLTNEIPITEELCEFLGYFISEGNAFSKGIIVSNTNRVIVARMRELGEKLFGIKSHEYVEGQVQFNSSILRRLFIELFGEGASSKKIPLIALGFSPLAKLSLIRGLFLGDGSKERKSAYDHLSYTTSSVALALGLWQLLLSVGVVGSVSYSKSSQSYRIRIDGKQLESLGDIFGPLRLTKSERVSRKYRIIGDMLYFGVRKVEKKLVHRARVYDLETNGSFTTSFLVHNSGYFWYFPLGEGRGHVGAGDFKAQYRGEIEALCEKYGWKVVRRIGRPVRILPPAYIGPFYTEPGCLNCGRTVRSSKILRSAGKISPAQTAAGVSSSGSQVALTTLENGVNSSDGRGSTRRGNGHAWCDCSSPRPDGPIVVGVGESIGTVYPLLGEGIIPSMQCVNLFVEHIDDMEAYSEAVLKHFDIYARVYRFIKAKVDGNFSMLSQFSDLAAIYWHMRSNERRYGLETHLRDILKVVGV